MGYTIYWTSIPTFTSTFIAFEDHTMALIHQENLNIRANYDTKFIFNGRYTRCQPFAVTPQSNGPHSCDTGRYSYTADVRTACILMVEYGLARKLSDDSGLGDDWIVALNEVNSQTPLKTYQQQFNYFLALG